MQAFEERYVFRHAWSVAVLSVCLVVLVSCGQQEEIEAPPPRPIAWITAELYSMDQVRKLSGVLEPSTNATLSFEVSGIIESVAANLGDTFNSGDVLARIDDKNYRINVQAARSELEQRKAERAEAERNYNRYKTLLESGDVTRSVFDTSETAFNTAKNAVEIAEARLQLAEKDLNDTVLRAPYSGRVSERLIEPSQQVSQGQAVFEIEGDEGLQVALRIPENLIQNIRLGQGVEVRFPVIPDLTVEATVFEIGVRASEANAFPVTLQLSEQNERLRAGMTTEIDIVFEGRGRTGYTGDVIRLPLSSVIPGEDDQFHVFVYNPDTTRVDRRPVQTENILNNEIFISEGLSEGEIVATAGVPYLQDKQIVTLLDEGIDRFN